MTLSTATAPYYDDMTPEKNFVRILFVPGRNIQARELTQIQSIIQNQIKIGGDFIHKNGTVVKPGEAYFSTGVDIVELEPTINGVSTTNILDQFVGKEVKNAIGVKAKILAIDTTATPTMFIKYISGAETTNAKKFVPAEQISVVDDETLLVKTKTTDKTGSIASINEGIYYINGFYVQVPAQTHIFDITGNRTGYIGLRFDETIVTHSDDVSLYDMSDGYINIASPGADRLKVSLTLFSYDSIDDLTDDKFINLMYVKEGVLQHGSAYSEFGEVEKIVARRTYDESGDYVVKQFSINPSEFRSNNRGIWNSSSSYLVGDVVSYIDADNKTTYYVALDEGKAGNLQPKHTSGIVSDGSIDWLQTKDPHINSGIYTPEIDSSLTKNKNDDAYGVYVVSPGKAYIKGFEVNKKSDSYIPFAKPRTTSKKINSINPANGVFWAVNNVVGIPDFRICELLTIKNCNDEVVGTCRVRNFEILDNTANPAVFALYVFDVKYSGISYETAWKKFEGTTFRADAVVSWEAISGTAFSATQNATVIHTSGTEFTNFNRITKLKFGTTETNLVSVVDDDQINVTALPSAIGDGSPIYEAIHYVYGNAKACMIQLAGYCGTLYDENKKHATTYFTRRLIDFTGNTTPFVFTLVDSSGETFVGSEDEYRVIDKSTGAFVSNVIYTITKSSLTVSSTNIVAGTEYSVYCLVGKSLDRAKEKTKTLKFKTIEFTTARQVSAKEFGLTEADIFKINSVTLSGGENVNFTPANIDDTKVYSSIGEVDITSWFQFDNGQRDDFYGQGTLKKISNQLIDKPIRISFTYFEHGFGDYFSVDSYVDVARRDVPYYGKIDLGSVLDFRPRISDNGLNYADIGSSVPDPLSIRGKLTFSSVVYSPGKDIIALSEAGDFSVISSAHGVDQSVPNNVFVVAKVDKNAYMGYVDQSSVKVTISPNRRYTMKDIASIDQRLSNAEEYISLSIMEKELLQTSVKDKYGLDRYKSGYYVDDFTTHGPGDTGSTDYKCAIKPHDGTLCPQWSADNIKLVEYNASNRDSQFYQVTGNQVTLKYTTAVMAENNNASRPEYVNPFMTWKFKGSLDIWPHEDSWIDNVTLPTIYKNVGLDKRQQILNTTIPGTVWGEWTAGPNIQSSRIVSTIPSTPGIPGYYIPAVTEYVPDPQPYYDPYPYTAPEPVVPAVAIDTYAPVAAVPASHPDAFANYVANFMQTISTPMPPAIAEHANDVPVIPQLIPQTVTVWSTNVSGGEGGWSNSALASQDVVFDSYAQAYDATYWFFHGEN